MPSHGSQCTYKQTAELHNGHEEIFPRGKSQTGSNSVNNIPQDQPLEVGEAVSSQAVEDSPVNETRNIETANLDSWDQKVSSVKTSAYGAPETPVEAVPGDLKIDSVSGEHLSPVQYPETMENPMDKHYSKNDWPSQLLAQATQRLLQEKGLLDKLKQPGCSNCLLEDCSNFPWADVIIRPAGKADMKEIMEIANSEMLLQTREDGQLVNEPKLHRILDRCKKELRPFIVAAVPEDELLDRTKWPAVSDAAFARYTKWSKQNSDGAGRTPIVGFAYVDCRESNLLLAAESTKYFGYATVVVHPKYRNRKIGSALLDRILLSTAPFHRSQIDFQWLCEDPGQIYEHPAANNARQYKAIYVETFQDSELPKAHSFHKDWLERFGFQQVGRLPCAKKEVLDCVTVWHDMIIWELNIQPTSNLR